MFNLIKSLTKAEKRAFRLYTGLIQNGDQLMHIKLFDILEKMKI